MSTVTVTNIVKSKIGDIVGNIFIGDADIDTNIDRPLPYLGRCIDLR